MIDRLFATLLFQFIILACRIIKFTMYPKIKILNSLNTVKKLATLELHYLLFIETNIYLFAFREFAKLILFFFVRQLSYLILLLLLKAY